MSTDETALTLCRRTLLATLGATIATPSFAAAPPAPAVLGLMSGEIGGTFIRIAADLETVVDPARLRIDPHMGKGSVQNIGDLINLPGVDLALVTADALGYVRQQKLYPGQIEHVQYICKLYDEDLHVCAGPSIKTLQDLDGKPVNIDVVGSGTSLTATNVFSALGIKPDFRHADPSTGMAQLQAGTVAANVYCIGRPGSLFQSVPASANLHLVPVPSNAEIEKTYIPGGTFTHADYPGLVPDGTEVQTVGVGVALANFGWQPGSARYQHLALFVDEFFSNFRTLLQPPHHPVWKRVNLAATLPGWTRFQPATDWLQREVFGQMASTEGQLTKAEKEQLFQEFQAWQKQQGR